MAAAEKRPKTAACLEEETTDDVGNGGWKSGEFRTKVVERMTDTLIEKHGLNLSRETVKSAVERFEEKVNGSANNEAEYIGVVRGKVKAIYSSSALPHRKIANKELYDYDRLSNLSDDLICHILSFLPTVVAYRTSVLSKRWRSLCSKVPDLHFNLPSTYTYPLRKRCIHSVNAVLLGRTQKIRKLSLHSNDGYCEPYEVQLWVMKALELGVEELDLYLLRDRIRNRTALLTRRLSTSESLRVLRLRGGGFVQPTLSSSSFVYLPSLKILHLELTAAATATGHQDSDSLSVFLSGCPHLEELSLHGSGLKLPIIISDLHFLKRLCLHLTNTRGGVNVIHPLQINVPSVEVVDIYDHSLYKYEIVNLFNVVDRATLCISKHPDFDSLYKLLQALSNVKSLSLQSATIEFLSKLDNLANLRLLQFHNLLYLWVRISENCSWDMLVSFLQNAPNLEVLIIEKHFKKIFERGKVGNMRWKGPTVIPICLSTSLKMLEFRGIQNLKAELDFTRYIIENSSKLEKVKIVTPKSKAAASLVERNLFKGKKKSSVFTWDIIQFEDHLDACKDSINTT